MATGSASLNQIAGDLKDRNHPGMARQFLHERFDIRSTAIGSSTIQRRRLPRPRQPLWKDRRSEDRLRLRFTIKHHRIPCLQAATEQDKSIDKEFIIEVRRGELMLRDMGYFVLDKFAAIEEVGAWWLTRLPLTTGVVLEDGRTLEKYLKSFRGDMIDLDVIVGQQRKKCRLIAMRAAPEVSTAQIVDGQTSESYTSLFILDGLANRFSAHFSGRFLEVDGGAVLEGEFHHTFMTRIHLSISRGFVVALGVVMSDGSLY